MDWFITNWMLVSGLLLSALGLWLLLPRAGGRLTLFGAAIALVGLVQLVSTLHSANWTAGDSKLTETILFSVFSLVALVSAVLMITNRNPVYAALWFALVTLSTCGLFLLQSAPFLAAATIIVYAGAIVVTFVFVIMLAQQSGSTICDQRSRQPLAATIASFVLLGALLSTIHTWQGQQLAHKTEPTVTAANPLSRLAADEPIGTLRGLGRSLFGDYLFATEMAGTLLLIASIGAIAMAPRRAEGRL
ncbi:MAG TPA: NADH-quinone oxidoreductase subunit J [Lacipirellulaceae bacterium]